jgi:hypothetical protein
MGGTDNERSDCKDYRTDFAPPNKIWSAPILALYECDNGGPLLGACQVIIMLSFSISKFLFFFPYQKERE